MARYEYDMMKAYGPGGNQARLVDRIASRMKPDDYEPQPLCAINQAYCDACRYKAVAALLNKLVAVSALARQMSLAWSDDVRYLCGLWEGPLLGDSVELRTPSPRITRVRRSMFMRTRALTMALWITSASTSRTGYCFSMVALVCPTSTDPEHH